MNNRKIYLVVCGDYDEYEVLCAYSTRELAEFAAHYVKGIGYSEYMDARVEEITLADDVTYMDTFK